MVDVQPAFQIIKVWLLNAREAIVDRNDFAVEELVEAEAWLKAPSLDSFSIAERVATACVIASIGGQITGAWAEICITSAGKKCSMERMNDLPSLASITLVAVSLP